MGVPRAGRKQCRSQAPQFDRPLRRYGRLCCGDHLSNRSPLIAGGLLALLLAVALLLLTPSFLVLVLLPDAATPAEISRLLPAAKEQLNRTRGFRWPAGYYRFLSAETRTADNLLVLHFEYRSYPFIAATSAYLASRCKPMEKIDPREMGFGWGPGTESELEYLRSGAQDPCS
jgi:hypothetical protein